MLSAGYFTGYAAKDKQMQKVLTYTVRQEDLARTAGGLVNLILKNCVRVTGHEISGAKFLPDGITADGHLVHVSERLRPGQTLRIVLPEDADKEKILPADYAKDHHGEPLTILYEDEDLVVVNKPAGVVCHPSPGHYADSMANYVAGIYAARGEAMVCRIVGRLDKETSGTLLFAKNRAACARLFRERQDGALERTYLAVVHGAFPEDREEGTIEGFVSATPGVLMVRQLTEDGKGQKAVTRYRVLRQSQNGAKEKDIALVECHILTGRTHQIRVQMAGLGHPLVGDTLYGPEAQEPDPDGHIKSMPGSRRALLHAVRLSLRQPFTGEAIEVTAPLPADFPVSHS